MDENSKANAAPAPEEKAQELTPEELNKVAGGGASPTQPNEAGWVELNSFSYQKIQY
jgi:hypothetical protein